MTQDNKTSSFLKAINKYAQQQSDAILKEAEEFKKQEIEKATKEAITDAYTLIQKNISVEKSKIVSEYAKREQKSRSELFIRRMQIVEEVFDKATDKLSSFTKTDEYNDYIRKSATEIAELFSGKSCIVYVKNDDTDKAQLIKGIIENCTVECDNSIIIGGIRCYCEELSMIADDTLDSKLLNQRQWFSENSDLKVV